MSRARLGDDLRVWLQTAVTWVRRGRLDDLRGELCNLCECQWVRGHHLGGGCNEERAAIALPDGGLGRAVDPNRVTCRTAV
jgi:hypothetical protein